jgi:hypothetical protein
MRLSIWSGLAVCASLAVPSAAMAATVTIRASGYENEVRYRAEPGERNDLRAEYDNTEATVTLTDPGSTVRAIGACDPLGDHAAVCRPPPRDSSPAVPASRFVDRIRAVLGDGDDRVNSTGASLATHLGAFGGPGDDVLGGDAGGDTLDGGDGRDRVDGGEGNDVLRGGPGPDVLDGGPGRDETSYRGRAQAILVDLADARPDGAPGERDRLKGFEVVTGGRGDDRLAGDAADNVLDGGSGRNLLIGRGGRDFLRNASGSRVSCGGGTDGFTRPRASTYVPRTCDRLVIPPPRGVGVDAFASLTPNPVRDRGRLGILVACPEIDGYPVDCSASLRIRDSASGRLLGTASAGVRWAYERFVRLRLTRVGRRMVADDDRSPVTVTVRGEMLPPTRWTIGI